MVVSLKCVVVGDSGVGKSSLLTRFVKGEFRALRSTISAAFLERRVDVDGITVNLEVWDTAGQERFRSLNTPMYYRGAVGALLVYDCCDNESWAHVPGWYSHLRMFGERNCQVALAGSKLDLAMDGRRAIETTEASDFAQAQDILFFETSAKTGEGVEDLFVRLARAMLNATKDNTRDNDTLKLTMPPSRTTSCR